MKCVSLYLCMGAVCALLSGGRSFHLSKQDIYRSFEEIMEYHVEFRSFSSVLARRGFKIFLEQFDPNRLYLLEEEASPFWYMDDVSLQKVVAEYHKGQYRAYERLSELVYFAIIRNREMRKSLYAEIIESTGVVVEAEEEGSGSFAISEEALRVRMKNHLLRLMQWEKDLEGGEEFSLLEKKTLVDLLEARLRRVEESYVSADREHHLTVHVLKALAKSLDAHTAFFTPEEAYDLRMNLEKHFEGVGVVLREGVRGVVIKEVLPEGPAYRSGLVHPGDLILSVDGQEVGLGGYQRVMEQLKGISGERVCLQLRKITGEIQEVELIRERILLSKDRISHYAVPFGHGVIGVISVPAFYEGVDGVSCESDIKDALHALKQKGEVLGVILDMRNNSGGFLSQAVKVAGLFMSGGVVVVSKYAEGQMQYMRDIDGKLYYQGPLVVLTSKASASAAEIVAQALQDYGLALVVGDDRTYGKGTIQYQTVTDPNASTYFKVTVGRYYTASGRSTQIEGVKADIVVPSLYASLHVGEKYLPYALKNDQIAPVFSDPLVDIEASSRSWFKKNYLPHVQKRVSYWTEMLSVLRVNSTYRLQYDKDFLSFLHWLQGGDRGLSSLCGVEDLQITEAVAVIKDMNLLQALQFSCRKKKASIEY